nr:hypothetical protein CFP56_20334 [Quercus suber]
MQIRRSRTECCIRIGTIIARCSGRSSSSSTAQFLFRRFPRVSPQLVASNVDLESPHGIVNERPENAVPYGVMFGRATSECIGMLMMADLFATLARSLSPQSKSLGPRSDCAWFNVVGVVIKLSPCRNRRPFSIDYYDTESSRTPRSCGQALSYWFCRLESATSGQSLMPSSAL